MAQETLLVGCGKMGGAMLQGWIERGSDPAAITIVEPMQEAAEQARGRFGVKAVGDGSELADDYNPEIVILAVKPQGLDEIAPLYRRFAGEVRRGIPLTPLDVASQARPLFLDDSLAGERRVAGGSQV